MEVTCYREAFRHGADIVVMVYPDYQYSPRLVTAMASMTASGHYDVALGSRILGGEMLVQAIYFGFRIGEFSCPTRYFEEASSINFRRSVKYGFGVLGSIL